MSCGFAAMAEYARAVSLVRAQLPSQSAVRVDVCDYAAPRPAGSLSADCDLVTGRTLQQAAGGCSIRVREPVRPLTSAHVGPLLDHEATLLQQHESPDALLGHS